MGNVPVLLGRCYLVFSCGDSEFLDRIQCGGLLLSVYLYSNPLGGPQTPFPYKAIDKIPLSNIWVQILTGLFMMNNLVFNAYITLRAFPLSAFIAILKFPDADMVRPRQV